MNTMNTQQEEKFYQNPDPKKKNLYKTLSKLPFFLLIFIILFIYISLTLTYILPLIFDTYDLDSYEDYMKSQRKMIMNPQFIQMVQFESIQNYNHQIVNFVKQQTSLLTEKQIYGIQTFFWLHFLGCFFMWALVKTIKTQPGYVPSDYKEAELHQYLQQEEQFIKQLKDQLRMKQRATRLQYEEKQYDEFMSQQGYQTQKQNYLFNSDQEETAQSNQIPQQQQVVLDGQSQQSFNDSEVQGQSNSRIFDRSESEVCYDEDINDNDLIGYDYEEEQEIIEKLKVIHQENTFKKANERFCKKCQKFKPDRTHHCSQCRTCILKMDHHCQWVDNCIGFYNYKYFIVMLFFASFSLVYVTSVYTSCYLDSTITEGISMFRMFSIALMFYFSLIVMLIVLCFSLFHFWLIANNKTTIEWCEKKKDSLTGKYDVGCFENMRQNLNSNPLLWLLPINPNLEGKGLEFKVKEGYEY